MWWTVLSIYAKVGAAAFGRENGSCFPRGVFGFFVTGGCSFAFSKCCKLCLFGSPLLYTSTYLSLHLCTDTDDSIHSVRHTHQYICRFSALNWNQSALWANSWMDRWLTWFFGLSLMLSGLGNFVVDCHIYNTSSSSVFANVAKKQNNVGIRRHYNWNDHAIAFDKGGWCHVF